MTRRSSALLSLAGAFLLAAACVSAQTAEPKVAPPKRIDYDGDRLFYNPAWKDKEIYREADLDDDPQIEIVIGFVATYKPEARNELKSDGRGYGRALPEKKDPIRNHVFYQIYDMGPDGRYALAKTIRGMDQLGRVELFTLDEDSPPALAFFSPGGEQYLDLSVYQWREGGWRLLFNHGTSESIELDVTDKPVAIRIGGRGRPGPGTACHDFTWDPATKSFRCLGA